MVLRVNVDDEKGVSVEEFLDAPTTDALELMRERGGKLVYPISQGTREARPAESLEITDRAPYSDLEIVRYESGAIRVCRDGKEQPSVVKGLLRSVAAEIGADLFNSKGGSKNSS